MIEVCGFKLSLTASIFEDSLLELDSSFCSEHPAANNAKDTNRLINITFGFIFVLLGLCILLDLCVLL